MGRRTRLVMLAAVLALAALSTPSRGAVARDRAPEWVTTTVRLFLYGDPPEGESIRLATDPPPIRHRAS